MGAFQLLSRVSEALWRARPRGSRIAVGALSAGFRIPNVLPDPQGWLVQERSLRVWERPLQCFSKCVWGGLKGGGRPPQGTK